MKPNGKKEESKQLQTSQSPRSLAIAERGVRTGTDFANLMSAIMSDLIEGRMTPSTANATCNAGGKLLRIVDMQYKYGTRSGNSTKSLTLAAVQDVPPGARSADR